MAKFARVGYGSQGQGLGRKAPEGYVYVVNDNVRVHDRIQVVATSKIGRKFATTAMPLSTFGENTVKGQQAKIDVLARGDKEVKRMLGDSVNDKFLTQKDLDLLAQGKITLVKSGSELAISRKGISRAEYQQRVRGGNLASVKGAKTERAEQAERSYTESKGEQE